MATWIVHLRLAENLLGRIPGLDPGAFAVGSIAPDSGIPDERWKTFTPPPEVSHFSLSGELPKDLADLRFYRHYVAPLNPQQDGGKPFSFLLGYFFHLVTDNLWAKQIGRPTLERFTVEFAADKGFIWEIKRDWYGLDFDYLRAHPDSLFWNLFLNCTYEEDYLNYMPAEAVRERVAYIQEFYQRDDEEVRAQFFERPDIYLTQEEMDRFVEQTTGLLERAYRMLWEEGVDTGGHNSVLDLLSASEV